MASQICVACSREFGSIMSLARHISQTHKISSQEYFDKLLNRSHENICICGSKKKFVNLSVGYAKTCSHKCGCKLSKEKLKKNTIKYHNFRQRTSNAVKEIWANRDDHERKRIALKGLNTALFSTSSKTASRLKRITAQEYEEMAIKDCRKYGLTFEPGKATEVITNFYDKRWRKLFGMPNG